MKGKALLNRLKMFLVVALGAVLLTGCDSSRYLVLNPQGPVAREELHLITLSVILIAIVIIPVFIILGLILYRYRDKPGNQADYKPNWDDSRVLEFIWWGIPIVIIAILGYQTAKTVFAVAKPPVENAKPITIEVTSLDWKWLFQYPDQHVATVNYCEIPAGVPVQFVLTANAPMNSFWVPQLGGQEYTMPGMEMNLWLQADKPGTYFGSGANFSGEGFADMKFQVVAKSEAEFNQWVAQVKQTAPALTQADYDKLSKPGLMQQTSYSSYPAGSFEKTVQENGGQYVNGMPGMDSPTGMAGMTGMTGNTMQQDSKK